MSDTTPKPSTESGLRLVRPSETCVCKDCNNLVTVAHKCPLCGKETARHPEAVEPEGYCVECGEGPMAADTLHVRTWEEDPYMQTDDGDLATVCETCRTAKAKHK